MINIKRFSSGVGGLVSIIIAIVFLTCETIPDYCGDGYRLNPKTQFCHNNKTYDLCGGGEYNPINEKCENGILKVKCSGNGKFYNSVTEFCHGDTVYTKCENSEYNPVTHDCFNNTLRIICADGNLAPQGFNCDGTPIVTYTLTLNRNPTAGGTVTGAGSYQEGQIVTITANPANNYTFANWTGGTVANAASATTTVTVNSNMTLTANFMQSGGTTYTLTTSANPTAGGTVTRSLDLTRYSAGTQVTVTAKPNVGYMFTGWSGASTSTNTEITVTMNANLTLTAEFTPAYTLTIDANPTEGGTVFVNNTASTGATAHARGAQITVRAEAARFYRFTGWTGSAASANATVTVNMNSDLTFTANFIGGQFNTDIDYSSFTDERDGKSYRTVKIGDLTWMAENLNFAGHILGTSWCYRDSISNCEIYGRLYDWELANSVCPDGWHLPDNDDWNNLVQTGGSDIGTKLKSKGWFGSTGITNGTDEFGFSALPGGYRYNISFISLGNGGYWWSATEYSTSSAHYRQMASSGNNVTSDYSVKRDGHSVRCVQ